MKNQNQTLNSRATELAQAVFNTFTAGSMFTTTEFTEAVFNSFQGEDRWETTNTTNQNKIKHVARWFQQTAKQQGLVVKVSRNLWQVVA